MSDILTQAERSALMAKVRGYGNRSTELRLIRFFRVHGVTGWRRHYALVGRPDFTFPKLKLAVFVDGCFWHGCPIHGAKPRQNAAFWRRKIARNRERDSEVNKLLRERNWQVLRIWEHELRRRNENRLVAKLIRLGLILKKPDSADRCR